MKHSIAFLFLLVGLPLWGNPTDSDTTKIVLNELVVVGTKVKVEQQGRNITISNIKGSDLSTAGTILDMMAWTPGLMLDNSEQVKVVGTEGWPTRRH